MKYRQIFQSASLLMAVLTTVTLASAPIDTTGSGEVPPKIPFDDLEKQILNGKADQMKGSIDQFVAKHQILKSVPLQDAIIQYFTDRHQVNKNESFEWRYGVCHKILLDTFYPIYPSLPPLLLPPPDPKTVVGPPQSSLVSDLTDSKPKVLEKDEKSEKDKKSTLESTAIIPYPSSTSSILSSLSSSSSSSSSSASSSVSVLSQQPKKLDDFRDKLPLHMRDVMFPQDILANLKKNTMGQDSALARIANAAHEHLAHLARIKHKVDNANLIAKKVKQNLLLVGPTGCGKTSSVDHLAQLLNVPMAMSSATDMTAQGYIGGKWQKVFDVLLKAAKGKKDLAERGIVFIDEIDKLCGFSASEDQGAFYQRVQQELLKPVEGTKVQIDNGPELDTSRMMFIFAGAFPGLEKIVKKGNPITPHDLEKYGMIKELVGRIGNIAEFGNLSKEQLLNIMEKSEDSILSLYKLKWKTDYNIDLTFTKKALEVIAEKSLALKTGARSLNTMINLVMENYKLRIPEFVGNKLEIEQKETNAQLQKYSNDELQNALKNDDSYQHMYL